MSRTKERISNSKTSELNFIIAQLIDANADFAVWNLPGNEEIKLSATFNGVVELDETGYEELEPGFIFSSFEGKPKYIPGQFIWSSTSGIEKSYPEIDLVEKQKLKKPSFPYSEKVNSTKKEDYTAYVNHCIQEIVRNNLQKIVPARVKNEVLDIHPVELFNALTNNYAEAFISLICLNDGGTWIGASPELLVSTNSENVFKTVALAGTQLNKGYEKLRDVLWTQKEIEEQAMVSRYIINSFKKIRLREFKEYGPKTAVAGNLLHLKTEFEVDMEATNFPQLGSVMLKLLHPTSAVCGMPLDLSRKYISENEKLDRKLFSGFLGPVNTDGNTSIFVNLRCLELTEDGANFYAGAGVTVDSIPEDEYNETEIKIETLKNLI